MSEAPERLWAWPIRRQGGIWLGNSVVQDKKPIRAEATEYIRADVVEKMVGDARKDRDYEC